MKQLDQKNKIITHNLFFYDFEMNFENFIDFAAILLQSLLKPEVGTWYFKSTDGTFAAALLKKYRR